MCLDCEDEDGAFCEGAGCCRCDCHERDPGEYRGDDDDDGPCMGAECVNPHPDHTYRECETAEMHEMAAPTPGSTEDK